MKKNIFEWNAGNKLKSLLKHGVTNIEADSVFEDKKMKVFEDLKHNSSENH